MIHTFELSKMISKDTFNAIITSLKVRNYGHCWLTMNYADKGFTVIRLYKFKRKDAKSEGQGESDFTHYYMITLSINTSNMFDGNGNPHLSQTILSFTPDYVKAIYFHIFELIPCLEQGKASYDRNSQIWFELNAFKAHRIDFAFDLKYMKQHYLTLINKGYSLRKKVYERSYYEDKNTQESFDDEPDIPDSEEVIKMIVDETGIKDGTKEPDSSYLSDVNYVYYKGKGVNINIYHKGTEIQKKQLSFDPDTDYDFLRIEVQVKKNKLNSIVSKFKLNKGELKGRELQYLISPEVEEYVLKSYVKALTGTGVYVTYDRAMKMIDESNYTKTKKECLKKVIEAVAKRHGIAKVLEQVENGTITDLGKLSTVKQYLKEIHGIGINPVTLSARMKVPKQILKNQSGGKDLSESVLPSLMDILSAYGNQMKDYQKNGEPITDEDIEQIMKL